MSTNLKEFDEQQDALVIFLNYQRDNRKEIIENYIKDCFEDLTTEYLLLDCQVKEYSNISGKDLFQLIRDKADRLEINLPDSNRLIFCSYMPLEKLDEEQYGIINNRVADLARLLPGVSQHHMFCFSYENIKPLEQKKNDVIGIMKKLGQDFPTQVSYVEYLIYATGFQTLDMQEHGLARLLHILSRRDRLKMVKPDYEANYLKMLQYADYYESRADFCQREIDNIKIWNTEEKDQDRNQFYAKARAVVHPVLEKFRSRKNGFEDNIQLYPASISEYRRRFFFWHVRDISVDHPMVQKQKKQFVKDIETVIAQNLDIEELEAYVRNELYYEDGCALQREIQNKRFIERILNSGEYLKEDEETKVFITNLLSQIGEKLKVSLEDIEERKKKLYKKQQKYVRELKEAGKYANIDECFQNINRDTKFNPMAGDFPEISDVIALIGGKCYDNWLHMNYDIAGIENAFRYPSIYPCEIVVLKQGNIVNLNKDDAEDKLRRMLD